MALIRQVRRHENSRMWAYVEWSDENQTHPTLLGVKEFHTKIDSCERVEPIELKTKRLNAEKEKLQNRLSEIEEELS